MSTALNTIVSGPFTREDFKILDADGRRIATISTSARIPTATIERIGDLLASAWDLREYLKHALTCSGTPVDCESCNEASRMLLAQESKSK